MPDERGVMEGGTGNGFQFRTRRPEDARAFIEEWQARGTRGRGGRRRTVVTVTLALLVLAIWFGWGLLG